MSKQFSMSLENTARSNTPFETSYEPIHVSQSTFLAGVSADIHRWFRLTPSFGPDLVNEMINVLGVQKHEYILDPFSGAATTSIESMLEGRDSLGFEINPLLHFVGRVCTDWTVDSDVIERTLHVVSADFSKRRSTVSFETLEANNYTIPPIHNPTRWWRPDVLKDLVVLLRSIDTCSEDTKVRDFLRLALAGVLVPDLTNITLGRLQLHFIDRTNDTIDVLSTFTWHVETMIGDLRTVQKLPTAGKAKILLQDSTNLAGLTLDRKIDCVITSPPYPNRYSYVWNTRPHLFLLGFLTNAKQAAEVDKTTIGGTWGSATSELQKGRVAPYNDAVEAVVGPVAEQIRISDNLMANYAMHYFNRLAKHIETLETISSPNMRVAYVVGNSWLKGVYIETDVLLAQIFECLELRYSISSIHRFRRRHSGDRLFESVVYARKS